MTEKKKEVGPMVFWLRALMDSVLFRDARRVSIGVDSQTVADHLAEVRELEAKHNRPSLRQIARAKGKSARTNRGRQRKPREN